MSTMAAILISSPAIVTMTIILGLKDRAINKEFNQ